MDANPVPPVPLWAIVAGVVALLVLFVLPVLVVICEGPEKRPFRIPPGDRHEPDQSRSSRPEGRRGLSLAPSA